MPGGIPASPEVIKALTWLPRHADQILRSHPGHHLVSLRRSHQVSLSIFETAANHLVTAITDFEQEAVRDNSTIFRRECDAQLKRIEENIQKEMFSVTAAAHSLVDHTRRLVAKIPVAEFAEHRLILFGDDGLHEFVIGLRTLLHHLQIVAAGAQTIQSAAGRSATFVLSRSALANAIEDHGGSFSAGQSTKIQSFIAGAPAHIDLRKLVEDYRDRALAFNQWLSKEIKTATPVEMSDYDRCRLEQKREGARLSWNALMGNWLKNWPAPPDPHKHLSKFLSENEIEAVYKLPRNSKEQVDLVIRFMDIDEAADDNIRNQAYELFERSPPLDLQGSATSGIPALPGARSQSDVSDAADAVPQFSMWHLVSRFISRLFEPGAP